MQETNSRQFFVEVCMCILKLAARNCRQPSMPGIVLCGWYARGIALSDVEMEAENEVVPTGALV